jgi:tRNA threonylcarbamoyladenosine biosynthesis protein TsaE
MQNDLGLGDLTQSFTYGLDDVESVVAERLLPFWREGAIFALSGEIGAGKTTISKVLLRKAGVVEEIVSPTYAYFCRYSLPGGINVHHFDLYRVGSLETFFDMEFGDVFHDDRNIIVIEWPEVIEEFLIESNLMSRVIWVDLQYDLVTPRERTISVRVTKKTN